MKKIFILSLLFFHAAAATAQSPAADSVKFTPDEFNVIVSGFQRGNIPAIADSLTLQAVQSLRIKLNEILAKKKSLQSFTLTATEKKIILYFLQNEIKSAITLLQLNQKLATENK